MADCALEATIIKDRSGHKILEEKLQGNSGTLTN
jgi:hypothetical protein